MEYLPVFRHVLTHPLVQGKEGAEVDVAKMLASYCLGK